jgi:hypothetical protein
MPAPVASTGAPKVVQSKDRPNPLLDNTKHISKKARRHRPPVSVQGVESDGNGEAAFKGSVGNF